MFFMLARNKNVERIAHNRDRADRGVEEGVRQHPRNQPVWCAELSGFPDEIGRYQTCDHVARHRDQSR